MSRSTAEAIPAELRALDQWVYWTLELRPGEDKPTKVLMQASGENASSTDASTWLPFEEVRDVLDAEGDGSGGVGFVFSADDPFYGVDLDGVRNPETGELHPRAREIVETYRQAGGYIEVSPSGKGVHIIARGTMPAGRGRKRNGAFGEGTALEMYDRARYFTMTGQTL